VNLLDAVRDRNLFAAWFDRGDWTAWCAFIAALFGLPMDDEQAAVYRQCTGRHTSPSQPFSEAWLVVGRRGGKSFIAALVAVFLAAFRDYREHLQPGERGTVLILAADRKQARTILRYVRALFAEVPMLSRLVERYRRGHRPDDARQYRGAYGIIPQRARLQHRGRPAG